MGVTPPDATPDVDTTASYEDVDGNGIDDDCQDVVAVVDADAAAAEALTVDTDADGVISTTEAAHSARIGGKNCNHGGYVSWIAHQKGDCTTEPTEEEPTAEEPGDGDEPAEGESVLLVTTPPDAEPDADAAACDEPADATDADADADAVKKDHKAAAAARLVAKAERTLAHAAAKAERTAAKATSKAERNAAKAAKQAERHAAKAAKAKHKTH